jgi:hypothetical protein
LEFGYQRVYRDANAFWVGAMKKFLCLIIDRATNQTLQEYPCIEARDWYYARHIAADKYVEEGNFRGENWYVDSLEL